MGKGVYSSMAKKGYKKNPVGGDITDMLPKDGKKSIFAGSWTPSPVRKGKR
jgi:hypothetical protein